MIFQFSVKVGKVEEFKLQTWLHSNATPGSRNWRGEDSPRSKNGRGREELQTTGDQF